MLCPICFSRSNGSSSHYSFESIQQKIDNVLDVAGPIPLQISGGEPTLNPDLPRIIHYSKNLGFRNIELVTNGIEISRDPQFLHPLVENGLSSVYLQFDSLCQEALQKIRGQDMREVRMSAVSAVRLADICCTLAVAVTRGINDHELGDIVRFGVENIDTVRAINFQSSSRFTGRFTLEGEVSGFALTELIHLIEKQSGMAPGGFQTELLGHPQCNGMSLIFVLKDKLEPLFTHISQETLNDFLGSKGREILADLFLGKERFARKHIFHPKGWKALLEASAIFGSSGGLSSVLQSRHLLLFAKSFMEKEDLRESRLSLCNYALAETDGLYSFCAYNNLRRFQNGGAS